MPPNKVIVTNLSALQAKYGAGYPLVQAAINRLIAADAVRGLNTLLIGLDDNQAMTAVGGAPVTKASDPAQNKSAIDAVYNHYTPDYIMILGAVDVVPQQDLVNPVYSAQDAADGDPDPIVFSDLPYACPGSYGTAISAFLNPTRVVGRLPDVTGGNDPAYLGKVIDSAANYSSSPTANYQNFLGVSAGVWTGSTTLSLQVAFATATGMNIVPPASSHWPQTSLDAPSHFFNCHGAPSTSQYFGQPASGAQVYPVAHDAAYIQGRIKPGTVVAAECCYGAELYDPTQTGKHQGIPNQYLEDGAYGFWGSTTVAYGPSDTNDWADLLCQYFFQSVLKGASLGRSALEARQTYIYNKGQLTGTDLKTLAQYILLGDPSVTPAAAAAPPPPAHLLVKGKAFVAANPVETANMERKTRRNDLIQNGLAIGSSVSTAEKKSKSRARSMILNLLQSEGAKLKLTNPSFASFDVNPASVLASASKFSPQKKTVNARGKSAKALADAVPRQELKAVHCTVGRIQAKSDFSVGIAGVEILEFEDCVTIRPFYSR